MLRRSLALLPLFPEEFYSFLCVSLLPEYIYTTSVPGAHGSQKRMWTPSELELHMVRGWKEGLAWWLRELAILSEDWGSIPSTHMAVDNCL